MSYPLAAFSTERVEDEKMNPAARKQKDNAVEPMLYMAPELNKHDLEADLRRRRQAKVVSNAARTDRKAMSASLIRDESQGRWLARHVPSSLERVGLAGGLAYIAFDRYDAFGCGLAVVQPISAAQRFEAPHHAYSACADCQRGRMN